MKSILINIVSNTQHKSIKVIQHFFQECLMFNLKLKIRNRTLWFFL